MLLFYIDVYVLVLQNILYHFLMNSPAFGGSIRHLIALGLRIVCLVISILYFFPGSPAENISRYIGFERQVFCV